MKMLEMSVQAVFNSFIRFALLILICWWNTKWGMLKSRIKFFASILRNLHQTINDVSCNATKMRERKRFAAKCYRVFVLFLFGINKNRKHFSQFHWHVKQRKHTYCFCLSCCCNCAAACAILVVLPSIVLVLVVSLLMVWQFVVGFFVLNIASHFPHLALRRLIKNTMPYAWTCVVGSKPSKHFQIVLSTQSIL